MARASRFYDQQSISVDSGKFEGAIDIDVEKASAMSTPTDREGTWDETETDFDDPNLDRAHIVLGELNPTDSHVF